MAAAVAAFLLLFSGPAPSADSGTKGVAKSGSTDASASPSGPDAPVAFVNGKPIPKAEYDRAVNAFYEQFRRMGAARGGAGTPPADTVREEVTKQLVNREILYQASLKYPVKDLQKKVEEEVQKLQTGAPSPEAFQEKLKANSMTEKDLKELIGKQLTIRNYVETQIVPKLKTSEADAKKFYDENKERFKTPEQMKASHLLVRVDPKAKPADKEKALAKARDLQKRAAKGEDFAKLARENSEDPGSAKNGGDLGFFAREQMVPPFANAAFALKDGQVSEVVETPFGYHVIKAGPKKAAELQSFSDVKAKLIDYLKAKAIDEAITRKVDELRKAATITVVGTVQK